MNREQAIRAALAELDRVGWKLKSREPIDATEKKAGMIEGRKMQGWSLAFPLVAPDGLPDMDMIMVEVYEPSGRVVVYDPF